MLERACLNVEPAAHFFLRNIERPIRSNRLLNPYFFRNEADHLEPLSWWPAYLESVRKVPQSSRDINIHDLLKPRQRTAVPQANFVKHASTSTSVKSRPQANLTRSQKSTRTYAQAATQRQQTKEDIEVEDIGRENGDSVAFTSTTAPAEHKSRSVTERDPTLAGSKIGRAKLEPPDPGTTKAQELSPAVLEKAWRGFMIMSDQETEAADVFWLLIKSSNKRDWHRAIKAFDAIPRNVRTLVMYRQAVDVHLKLLRHKEAINLVLDARQMGFNLAPHAMAHFVKNLLWNSAADLWTGQDAYTPLSARGGNDPELDQRDFREVFEKMVDLPVKVFNLAERLDSSDPVYATRRTILLDLYEQLNLVIAKSRTILRSITPKGLFSILDFSNALLKIQLRPIILTTLRMMSEDFNNRSAFSQLALLVYRNWRFVAPQDTIPLSSLHDLTQICVCARESTDVYDYLLMEGCKLYGKPPKGIYIKIFSACARQGQADALQGYFEDFVHDYGRPTDLRVLNHLINVYARTGNVVEAKKHFDRIESHYLQIPGTGAWNTLMLAHVRSLDPASAFGVYERMRENGITPDGYTFGMLVNLVGQTGDVDATSRLLAEAKSQNVEMTLSMYESIAESHLAKDDAQGAQRMVELATTIFPQQRVVRGWNSLLRHFAHNGDSEAILRIQARMRALDVKPDPMTYAALMTALVSIGKTKDAAKILRSLHLSQNMDATEMHFAIILHGFVKEGNRDMATLVYDEMRQRFPALNRSAEIAYLKALCDRDSEAIRPDRTKFAYIKTPCEHAIAHLRGLVDNLSSADFASEAPQPGLGKRSQVRGSVSQFYEVVLESLLSDGHYEEARSLFQEFEQLRSSRLADLGSYLEPSILMLTIKMELDADQRDWQGVEAVWNGIFTSAKKQFRDLGQVHYGNSQESTLSAPTITNGGGDSKNASSTLLQSLPTAPIDIASMIQPQDGVSHHHRFSLSRPLTVYCRALHVFEKHERMIELVEETFPQAGFMPNNHNWNCYIQILSMSKNAEHRIRAFRVFELKMFPLLPRWSELQRGKCLVLVATAKETSAKPLIRDRKEYARLRPEVPFPSYLTVTFLGAALAKVFREARESGSSSELDAIQSQAPNTVRYLQATPHIKDRTQGFLLRGRTITGDLGKRARSEKSHREQITSPGGILGSESPYENAPSEYLPEIEEALRPQNQVRELLRGDTNDQQHESIQRHEQDLKLGDKLIGPVNRTPLVLPRRARFETQEEQDRREKSEVKERIRLAQVLRKDMKRKHFFSDRYGGVPVISSRPIPLQDSTQSTRNDIIRDAKVADKIAQQVPRALTPSESLAEPGFSLELRKLKQRVSPRLANKQPPTTQKFIHKKGKKLSKNQSPEATDGWVI